MSYRHTLLSSLGVLALSATAQTGIAATSWQYFGGQDNYVNGIPQTLMKLNHQLPSDLLPKIYARLPEGLDINQNRDEKKLLTDNLGANIYLLEDSDITVIALGGNTEYTNSIGFFSYDAGNAPRSTSGLNTKIIFPNFSALNPGDAVSLGTFKAGKAVGFVIVSDGWTGSSVNPDQPADKIFYTIRDLNPETPSNDGNSHLNAHTILLSSPTDNLMVLGFEDAYRHPSNEDQTKPLRSDDDFNDVLLAIRVTKALSNVDHTAVQPLEPVVPAPDSDGDGIGDDIDAFPLDPARAARRFYPSATEHSHLVFEDNWPKKGDFDTNDLVPRTAINTARTTLSIRNQAPVALPPETGQSEAVFILAPHVKDLTLTGLSWPCGFFNTVNSCPRFAPVPLVAEIHFQPPVSKAQLGHAPYNPFIYPGWYGQRGREIHLANRPPTAKADPKLFGTEDDRSDPARGRYYLTADNQSWGLDVPEKDWRHPAEWNAVGIAYPDFATWATSYGTTAPTWYVSPVKEGAVFQR